jgi:hypothetical protein
VESSSPHALDESGKLKPARAQRGVEPTAEVQGGAREGDVTEAAPCRRLVGVQAGRCAPRPAPHLASRLGPLLIKIKVGIVSLNKENASSLKEEANVFGPLGSGSSSIIIGTDPHPSIKKQKY